MLIIEKLPLYQKQVLGMARKYEKIGIIASDVLMDKGLKIYLEEKADVFVSKQLDNFADFQATV